LGKIAQRSETYITAVDSSSAEVTAWKINEVTWEQQSGKIRYIVDGTTVAAVVRKSDGLGI
jgi:hypothetical protein